MKTRNKRAIAALTLAAAAWLPAAGALADDTAEEIRLLKAQLRKLEQRLDQQDRIARAKPRGGMSNAMVVKGPLPEPSGPDAFYFKGLKITPGGFFAMETVYRDHWLGADVNTPFGGIPFGGSAFEHTPETRFSARQSRLSMLVQGNIDPQTHVQGYVETDFLGAGETANSNESNSYNLRIRQMYSNIDWDNWGLHLTAGQMWSLATLNSNAIRVDNFLNPATIDAQYVPGFVWARQPGIRITKDLPYNLSAAFSVEGSATTWANNGTPITGAPGGIAVTNLLLAGGCAGGAVACGFPLLGGAPAAGGLFNNANGYSFNRLPDIIGKVAWDPTFFDRHIHVEGFGILRDFDDRLYFGDHNVWAGGGGGSVVIPVLPKLFDVQVSGAFGHGIGRYGTGDGGASGLSGTAAAVAGTTANGGIGGWDASYGLDGGILPIQTRMILVGGTAHATPFTDVYIYAGGEFNGKNDQYGWWGKTLLTSGFGGFLNNNAGCQIELPSAYGLGVPTGVAGTCANQTKALRQITTGIWQTVYAGDFGKVKVGAQYSYTVRDLFQGVGGSPRADENIFLTSLRYYPF